MKKYLLIAILTTFSIMETMAQFPPTKEQLANIKKIEELQKSNKKGKNKGEIIKLLNANQKVNKDIDKDKFIEELKKEGRTIAYISHKFKEIFVVADRYVVLRDGQTVDEGAIKEATQESLIRKMTGRDIASRPASALNNQAPVLLTVKDLCLRQGNKNRLDHLSFELKEGEILGIYGLMGAGRTELMESIFGLHPASMSGNITVKGKRYIIHQPADAIKAGIALVPEDRKLQGLVLNQSVNKNIGITILQILERP